MIGVAGDNLGLCMPSCNPFASEGPPCSSGTTCVPTALPLPPPGVSQIDYAAFTGVCAQNCTPDGGSPGSSSTDGGVDAGTLDGGIGGSGVDGGLPGADAGSFGCAPQTACVNGSITQTVENVCLP